MNLANEARELANEGYFSQALRLIERAIRLDQINGLNEFYALRAHVSKELGNHDPASACAFYEQAFQWSKAGRYLDAKVAYLEASTLDRFFLWPANNYAWLMSTCREPSARDGPEAVKVAFWVCKESQWNCWAFIGTLAAACAAAGDFAKAAEWQMAAIELCSPNHRMEAVIQLRHFQAGHALIDGGSPVAGGDGNSDMPDPRPACDSRDAEAKEQTNLLRTLVLQNLFRSIFNK